MHYFQTKDISLLRGIKRIAFWLIILYIVLYVCSIPSKIRANKEHIITPLSQSEIQEYIENNNLKPVGVHDIYGTMTIILEMGHSYIKHYVVYKSDGQIYDGGWLYSGEMNGAEKIFIDEPIKLGMGTSSGEYPYQTFYLIDELYLNQGYTIVFISNKGKSNAIELNAIGNVLETKMLGDERYYEIYDNNGNIIFTNMKTTDQ